MPDDIIALLVELLEDEWTASNTTNITPTFATGWIDVQHGPHQVIVAGTPDESALGASGIYGIESGGGNHQMLRGLTFVESYCEKGDGLPNPKGLAYQFAREVQRIIMANCTEIDGYDYVSYLGHTRIQPGRNDHPDWMRYSSRIGYMFRYVNT